MTETGFPCINCGAAYGCEHRSGIERPAAPEPSPIDKRTITGTYDGRGYNFRGRKVKGRNAK